MLVDYVGRFECLAADFQKVCKELGLSNTALPHKNKSRHRHYTDYYDDECRELVSNLWPRDIDTFGYSFGG
jgi:hypothetical protein